MENISENPIAVNQEICAISVLNFNKKTCSFQAGFKL
jgi:hypothetical protein